ncbi:MAG: hypothetical protein CL565_06390 [Alphaproteobacteria bacterium]|nr:hypothetical protein [Alphaproteobacteria bacterium]
MTLKKTSFPVFLAIWNQSQGLKTPDIHFYIASWLEEKWEKGEQNLCLMAFRSCGKSTLVGLFVAWLLYADPNLRILILAAETSLASKMAANVRRIIEKHVLSQTLKPRVPEHWSGERFTVNREIELRDPSVTARGITSNTTGSRADIIICDDVEVPNTCDTAEKRLELRERLSEIDFIQTGKGFQLYVGTPHTYYSIYRQRGLREINEDKGFLNGFSFLKIPLLTLCGKSNWPERFPMKAIENLRKKVGPNKFSSQMMLKPVNILNGRLNISQLRKYSGTLDYTECQQKPVLRLNSQELVSASSWWDPAFGAAGGDGSVVAVIYSDELGNKYIHNVSYIKTDPNYDLDEATQQCRKICNIIKDYYLPSITIETNGIGKFLPAILRRELALKKINCAVIEKTSTRSKDLRILEAFDAPLAAGSVYVYEDVYKTPFIREFQEWRPGKSSAKDDGLDAVSSALSQEPIRIKRFYMRNTQKQNWRASTQAHKARTVED